MEKGLIAEETTYSNITHWNQDAPIDARFKRGDTITLWCDRAFQTAIIIDDYLEKMKNGKTTRRLILDIHGFEVEGYFSKNNNFWVGMEI